ncbi:MAG: hypothetical protein M3R17_16865 [Bacteroidota bacterium]|nr:hypothetical protein [Bacteroidota bacterium]
MRQSQLLIFLLCIPVLFISCETKKSPQDRINTNDTTAVVTTVDSCGAALNKDSFAIEYGTSFGMCNGYCNLDWKFSRHCISHTKRGNNTKDYPTIIQQNSFSEQKWKDLIAKMDISKFAALEERIGCPDCADGGAEWVAIPVNGKRKEVVFEYGNAPAAIAELVDKLRAETK